MKICYDCIPCLLHSIIKLFNNGVVQEDKQEYIFKKILKLLSEENFNYSPPKIAQQIHRIIRQVSNNPDPYKEIKQKYNNLCLDMYEDLKIKINNSDNSFFMGLKLAILGNIIDFGLNHSFNLVDTIGRLNKIHFAIDNSQNLFNDIKKAKSILYIGDNAGEIVFDKILLEIINHPDLYFSVRGAPVINDITREDAYFIGIDKIAKLIDTGTDIPGVDLDTSSAEFKDVFKKVDLVISKGQGNYESLCDIKDKKEIYFLLMVKCDLVAKQVGVKKGDIIVKENI